MLHVCYAIKSCVHATVILVVCYYITDACWHILQTITMLPPDMVTFMHACMHACSYIQLLATITLLSLPVF